MTRLHPDIVGRVEAYICVAALINFFVGARKIGLVEVQAALRAEGLKVSLPTIGKEAYRLGLGTSSGRRPGTIMPATAKRGRSGGRPPGPGKKYSLNREKVIELRGLGLSLRAIAEKTGLTPEGVRKLLLPDLSKPSTDDK